MNEEIEMGVVKLCEVSGLFFVEWDDGRLVVVMCGCGGDVCGGGDCGGEKKSEVVFYGRGCVGGVSCEDIVVGCEEGLDLRFSFLIIG